MPKWAPGDRDLLPILRLRTRTDSRQYGDSFPGDFKNRELGWAVEVDTESSSIRVIFRKQSQPIQSTEELSQGGAVGRMRNLPPTRERSEYVTLGAWQRGSRDASF